MKEEYAGKIIIVKIVKLTMAEINQMKNGKILEGDKVSVGLEVGE